MKVIVAIFRDGYDHLFRLANADYHACVSAAELTRWKDTLTRVLTESERLDCKRATPYDRAQMAKAIVTAKTRMSQADIRIAQLSTTAGPRGALGANAHAPPPTD